VGTRGCSFVRRVAGAQQPARPGAERGEDALPEDRLGRLAGSGLDDHAEQPVADVAVDDPLPRRPDARRQPGIDEGAQRRDAFLGGGERGRKARVEAGRVREEMPERERLPARRGGEVDVGEPAPHRIVEGERPLRLEAEDDGGGERLRERGDPERIVEGQRAAGGDIGSPVGLLDHHLPLEGHADDEAGHPAPLEQVVDDAVELEAECGPRHGHGIQLFGLERARGEIGRRGRDREERNGERPDGHPEQRCAATPHARTASSVRT
jgi:hypothetical protein